MADDRDREAEDSAIGEDHEAGEEESCSKKNRNPMLLL